MVGFGSEPVDAGRVVIVGAGAAGARFADAMRSGGFEGEVVLLGEEHDAPYHRPLLSKDVLTQARDVNEILLSSRAEMAERGIDFRSGVRAIGIDRDARVVQTDGSAEDVPYDTLVIATGVKPRAFGTLPLGMRLHTLHTSPECLDLRDALRTADSVAVIGSGFIGNEIAASVRGLGKEVQLISTSEFPLQNAVGRFAGGRIAKMHEEHGVQMRMRTRAVELGEAGDGVRVELADGEIVSADIAIIGVGSNPTTTWLEESGLEIIDGLIVDENGRTIDPNIWAIGDVARRRAADGSTNRVEHWTNATEQADALARHLLGRRPSPIPKVDYLWTDIYGVKIQMFGHFRHEAIEHVLLDEPDRFIVAHTIDDRLVGIVAQGVAGRFMRFRLPVATGGTVDQLRAVAA